MQQRLAKAQAYLNTLSVNARYRASLVPVSQTQPFPIFSWLGYEKIISEMN